MLKFYSAFMYGLAVCILSSGCLADNKKKCISGYKGQPIKSIQIFAAALKDSVECEDQKLFQKLLGEDAVLRGIKIQYEEGQDVEKLLGYVFRTWQISAQKSLRVKTDEIIGVVPLLNYQKLLGKGYSLIEQKDQDFRIYALPDYKKLKTGEPFFKIKQYKNYWWIDSYLIKQKLKPITDIKRFHLVLQQSVNQNKLDDFINLMRQERIVSFAATDEHYLTNAGLIKLNPQFSLKHLKSALSRGYQVWQKKSRQCLCDEMIFPVQPSLENAAFVKRGMEIWVKNCDGQGWEMNSLYQP